MTEQFDHIRFQRRLTALVHKSITRLNLNRDATAVYSHPVLLGAFQTKIMNQPTGNNQNATISLMRKSNPQLKEKKAQGIVPHDPSASLFMNHEEYVTLSKTKVSHNSGENQESKSEEIEKEVKGVESDLAWIVSVYEQSEARNEYDRQIKSMIQTKRNSVKQSLGLFGLKMFFSATIQMLTHLPSVEMSTYAVSNLQTLASSLGNYEQSMCLQNNPLHIYANHQITESILPAFKNAMLHTKNLKIQVLLLTALVQFLKVSPSCRNWSFFLEFLQENHEKLKLDSRSSLMNKICDILENFKSQICVQLPEEEGISSKLDQLITIEKTIVNPTGIGPLDFECQNHSGAEVLTDGTYFYYLIKSHLYVIGNGYHGTILGELCDDINLSKSYNTMCLYKGYILLLGLKKEEFTIQPLYGRQREEEEIKAIETHLKKVRAITQIKSNIYFKVQAVGDDLYFFMSSSNNTYTRDNRRLRLEIYNKNGASKHANPLNNKSNSSISISTGERKNWSVFCQSDMIIVQQRLAENKSKLFIYEKERNQAKLEVTVQGNFSCIDLHNHCLWDFKSDRFDIQKQVVSYLTFEKVWNPLILRSFKFSSLLDYETQAEVEQSVKAITKFRHTTLNYDTLLLHLIHRIATYIEENCSYLPLEAYMKSEGLLSTIFQPFGDFSPALLKFVVGDLGARLAHGIQQAPHQLLVCYSDMLIINNFIERAIRIKEYKEVKKVVVPAFFEKLVQLCEKPKKIQSLVYGEFLKEIQEFLAVNIIRLNISGQIEEENNWNQAAQAVVKIVGSPVTLKSDMKLRLIDLIVMKAAQSLTVTNIEMGSMFLQLCLNTISGVVSVAIRTVNQKVLKEASGAIVFINEFVSKLLSALYYKQTEPKKALFAKLLPKYLELTSELFRVGFKAVKVVKNEEKVMRIINHSRVVSNLNVMVRYYKLNKIELDGLLKLVLPMLETKANIDRFQDIKGVFIQLTDALGWLIGKVFQGLLEAKHIQKMPKPTMFEESMELDQRVALVETVQYLLSSKLFSGGIQLKKIGHISEEFMEKIKSLGIFNDASLELVEPVLISQGSYEEGSKLESLINMGTDQTLDQFLNALQNELIKVDPRARVGGKSGQKLTRYAFAGMLKFSGLLGDFQTLTNQIALGLFQPSDLQSIRSQNSQIMKKFESKWATASQMRAWLQSQKNQFGEKGESDEYLQEKEKELVHKVRERIEFLLRFQKPEIWDLEEDKEGDEGDNDAPILVRAQSSADHSRSESTDHETGLDEPKLVSQHSSGSFRKNSYSGVIMHHSEEEVESLQSKIEYWTHKIKDWKLIQKSKGLVKNFQIRQKEMFSSLTTSVLAYLQADIPVNLIHHQIHLNYLIICERIFVFQQLYQFLHQNKDIEFSRFKSILDRYMSFFKSEGGPRHFLRGLKGYGQEISSLLQSKFFQLIDVVIEKLQTTKNANDCAVLVDFLNWNYSARDHKDVFKRGIFSSLVGARTSFLTNFWLNQEMLELAAKQEPISPLFKIGGNVDFANQLYATFFDMSEQIVIRALNTREGGLEPSTSLDSSASSLKMPSLDRYQSSIDQNSTESLLNWILNFTSVQIIKMAKLLSFYSIYLEGEIRKMKIEQLQRIQKEANKVNKEVNKEDQNEETFIRSLFDTGSDEETETPSEEVKDLPKSSQQKEESKEQELQTKDESNIEKPLKLGQSLQNLEKPKSYTTDVHKFCKHYLSKLCSFFQKFCLLVEGQEQSLPFQCLLKYIAPKFISAMIGLLIRSPDNNVQINILGCFTSMLKIFPVEMFHEAVRITLQKEEIAKFLFDGQNVELKLLTSSLFTVIYKFSFKFQQFYHTFKIASDKSQFLRTLACMKEFLRFYIAQISNDELDFLEEQISNFKYESKEYMKEFKFILQILGGQLRRYQVGQEVFVRVYQDIPLERRGFILQVLKTNQPIAAQQFVILIGTDCISCKTNEFELVTPTSCTRISQLICFRPSLLNRIAANFSYIIRESGTEQERIYEGASLAILIRILKMFQSIIDSNSSYTAQALFMQDCLSEQFTSVTDAHVGFRSVVLEHQAHKFFTSPLVKVQSQSLTELLSKVSLNSAVTQCIKSLPDLTSRFILQKHSSFITFFPQLQINRAKVFPALNSQNPQLSLSLFHKLVSNIFFKLLLRDDDFRSHHISSPTQLQCLLKYLYQIFTQLSQSPKYEPQDMELVLSVYEKLSLSKEQIIKKLVDLFCSQLRDKPFVIHSIVLIGHFLIQHSPQVCFDIFFEPLVASIMKLADYPYHIILHRGFLHQTVAALFDYLLAHSHQILSNFEFCQTFSNLYPHPSYATKCLEIPEKLGQLADPIFSIWTQVMRYLIIVHYRINFKYPFLSHPRQWLKATNSKAIRRFLLCVDSKQESLSYQQEWESVSKKSSKDLQFYIYECLDKIVLNHEDYAQFQINDLCNFLGIGYNSKVQMTRSLERDLQIQPDKKYTPVIQEGGTIEHLKLHKKSKLVVEIQTGYDQKLMDRKIPKYYIPDYNMSEILGSGIKKFRINQDLLVLLTDKRDLYAGFASDNFKLYILHHEIDDFCVVSSELIFASSSCHVLQLKINPSVKAPDQPIKYQVPEILDKFEIFHFSARKLALHNSNHLVLARVENGLQIQEIYQLDQGTKLLQSGDDLCVVEDQVNLYIYDNLQRCDPLFVRAPQAGVKQVYLSKDEKCMVLLENGAIYLKFKTEPWEEVKINIFQEEPSKIVELQFNRVDSFFYAFEAVEEQDCQRRIQMKEMNQDIMHKKTKAKGKPSQGLLEWKKAMIQKKKELKTEEQKKAEATEEERIEDIEVLKPAEQSYTWVYRLHIQNDTQISFYDKIDKGVKVRDYQTQGGKILKVLERRTIPDIEKNNLENLLELSPNPEFDFIFGYSIEKNGTDLQNPELVAKIKECLNLEETSTDWQYHCLCQDYNRSYKFSLRQSRFEVYKRDLFQTLPFILIRSKHPVKQAKSVIKIYHFYNAKAIGKPEMSHIAPMWPMFEIFKEPSQESEKEETKEKAKDFSKLDNELQGWIVKAFEKSRIRVSGTITLDGGIKAISKGFTSIKDDLGPSATEGFSQLDIEERARILFFRSHRSMNLLCFANFRSPERMAVSSITGIMYRKKMKETLFFYKQAFLRALMGGAKRGNGLGMITIDRFMAHSFARRGIQDQTGTVTVFGQVMNKIDSKAERYTSLLMNRASQNPWEVRFAGEKGIDAGGLTRESVDELSNELQSPQLSLLIKTPNNRNEYGEQREKWILNPSARSLRELEMFRFLGGMLACSIRGEKKMILDLAGLVYKKLMNLEVTDGDLKNVDNYCVKSLEDIQNLIKEGGLNIEDLFEEKFVTCLSNGEEIQLMSGGKELLLTNENVSQYEALVKKARKNESDQQMKALKAGFEIVLDPCFINFFTPKELEILICGSPDITTAAFQAITDNPFSSPMKKMFWEVFEQLPQAYRAKYLRFAWGRSRLPHAGESLSDRHKLHSAGGSKPDSRLPVGHTCFFSVDMPNYSSKQIMKERLLYTLNNCQAIDGDGGSFVAFFDDEL